MYNIYVINNKFDATLYSMYDGMKWNSEYFCVSAARPAVLRSPLPHCCASPRVPHSGHHAAHHHHTSEFIFTGKDLLVLFMFSCKSFGFLTHFCSGSISFQNGTYWKIVKRLHLLVIFTILSIILLYQQRNKSTYFTAKFSLKFFV